MCVCCLYIFDVCHVISIDSNLRRLDLLISIYRTRSIRLLHFKKTSIISYFFSMCLGSLNVDTIKCYGQNIRICGVIYNMLCCVHPYLLLGLMSHMKEAKSIHGSFFTLMLDAI